MSWSLHLPFAHDPWILAAAMALDLLLGDPRWLPHPIRLIGRAIELGEAATRRLPLPPLWQGALLSVAVVGVAAGATWGVVRGAASLAPWAGRAAATVMVFYGLSLRCLGDEVVGVARALEGEGLQQARRRLSFIVGRETAEMDRAQVSMGAIETAAENLVDGFAAPLFYAALAGPVGIMAYKAINTLDSMIGYRNRRYARFGTFAARMDDVANYIPARLTLLVLSMAAPLAGRGTPWSLLRRALMEARKHSSPNSGLPEAAFALLLGIRLGGPARYGSQICHRPFMAGENPPPGPRDIRRGVLLLYGCGATYGLIFFFYANFFC